MKNKKKYAQADEHANHPADTRQSAADADHLAIDASQSATDLDQQWFDHHMSGQLQQFDAVHEPDLPQSFEFEAMVKDYKREMTRNQWRDLLLFWLIALPVLGGMFWVIERDWIWFAILQSIITAGAVIYVAMTYRQRVKRQWKN